MMGGTARDLQICPSCGRTWGRRAAFCGACGDRLSAAPLGAQSVSPPTARAGVPWWRRPEARWSALAVVVLVAAVAVPTITLQGPASVAGDVGVPDSDDLEPLAPDDPRGPPPTPPDISCTRGGQPVDCVSWTYYVPSRGAGFDAVSAHGSVVVSWDRGFGGTGVLALDAETGTRRWDVRLDGVLRGLEIQEDVVQVATHDGVRILEVDTGQVRWEAPTAVEQLSGQLLSTDHVYTHAVQTSSGPWGDTLQARSITDGSIVWEWTSSSPSMSDHHVLRSLPDERLLVSSFGGGLMVLDGRTGEPVWTTDTTGHDWWAMGETILGMRYPDVDPSGPNPAGDPGAVITAFSAHDGSTRWQQPIRAGDVMLGITPELVTAPSTGLLTAIDVATGEVRWEVEADEREYGATIEGIFGARARFGPVDRIVTMGERTGRVRARDAETGTVVWEHDLSGSRDGFPFAIVASEHVRVMGDRAVTYLDLETGEQLLEVKGAGVVPMFGDASLATAPPGHLVRLEVPGLD